MQALARDGLTDDQVAAILRADVLQVASGCDLLSADLSFVEDISDDLQDGTVSRVMGATVHGTCVLTLTRLLDWGLALVRPWMRVTDATTGLTARFNLGVYTLTTPEDVFGETPRTYDSVQGYDRLYLLDREVGDSYRVTAGTGYLAAVRSAIAAAGLTGVLLDGTAEAKTLPADRLWPLLDEGRATTWLRIVNDLLDAINYRGVWADENGNFRAMPYVAPTDRTAEFLFDADDSAETIVGQDRVRVQDQWKAPNRWVFVRQNMPGDPPPEPTEGAGLYTVPNTTGLLTRTRTVVLDAAGQDELVAQGDRIVANDQRFSTTLQVPTGPFPAAGHADIYTYTDAELAGSSKVQAVQWTLPLSGADMEWTWEVVD